MDENLLREGERKLAQIGMAFTGSKPDAGNSPRIAREYFDSLHLELRTIDAVEASTRMRLFGGDFATPVMVAALSGLDRICPNGMIETARGAAAAGAVMWAGIGDEAELKGMIDTGARVVKIVKPYRDHELIFEKLAQAERLGAFAAGMDIDFVFGKKDGSALFPMTPKTLDDIRTFVKATRLPFVLKGVLSERDAAKALEAGAAGVMVSNHGGAVLDYALPPLRVLPRVAGIIGGKIPVFLDGGVARGVDAFKALARGASGVGVGKAVMAGLASAGAEGVRKVLDGVTRELKRTMSITGAAGLDSIDPTAVVGPA